MRKLLIALVLAAGAAACTTPPPFERGPDFGPDPGTAEDCASARPAGPCPVVVQP